MCAPRAAPADDDKKTDRCTTESRQQSSRSGCSSLWPLPFRLNATIQLTYKSLDALYWIDEMIKLEGTRVETQKAKSVKM